MLLQLLANGLVLGSLYALLALGFALVYNTTKIFHIAYAALYMLCPYIILTLYKSTHLPLLISFIIAIIFIAICSVIIELFIYRPLTKKKSSPYIVLVSSLSVMIVIVNLVAISYGNETHMLELSIPKNISFGRITLTYLQLIQLFFCVIIILFFLIILNRSNFGIKIRAIRDDPVLYSIFGMNIYKMRLILFALSGLFVAFGSSLKSYETGMNPYVGMPILLNAVVALIVGGVGRFEAPILGGFLIGLLQSTVIWALSSSWQDAVTFTLLILFLIFRPQGILGDRQREV